MAGEIGVTDLSGQTSAKEMLVVDSASMSGTSFGPRISEAVQVDYGLAMKAVVDLLSSINNRLGMLVSEQTGIDPD